MTVTCNKCNWVSFAVTRQEAEQQIATFNKYFETLSKQQQQDYYGGKGSSIDNYTCLYCNGSDFRPSQDGDCPDGCTINPVIYEAP